MTHPGTTLSCLLVLTLMLPAGVGLRAQQLDPTYPPAPTDTGVVDEGQAPPAEEPAPPGSPDAPPTWSQQRTTTNRAGTVTNTHQQTASEDGSQYLRQHVVTNPRGQMVQSWERSQTEDGYLYRWQHTWTAPDGSPLRQHERTIFGTDPYNYTREHQITLRDGRTISHRWTRSWDGTAGTIERTFAGPNGQTRQFQRAWSPDDPLPAEPSPMPTEPTPPEPQPLPGMPEAGSLGAVSPPVDQPKKWGWLGNLNPLRKMGGLFSSPKPSPPRRSGFTVGSAGSARIGRVAYGLSSTQPGQPSPNSHRPSWAGQPGASAKKTSQTPMRPRPTPGHGKNR